MATLITSAQNLGNDVVQVNGTVNGVQVTAQGWMSAMVGMTPAQKLAYGHGLLNAAAPVAPVDLGLSG